NICVAGTHGKTTISTMVAHLLRHTGYGCNAFLGGVSANYNTNFWASERNVCVIEADEYDRSFLKLSPDIAVVTSMDPDHLDIYHTAEAMEQAFVDFAGNTKNGGLLLYKHGLDRLNEAHVAHQMTYDRYAPNSDGGTNGTLNDKTPDVYTRNVSTQAYGYRFDVVIGGQVIEQLELNVGGLHNIENMTVAITIGHLLKIGKDLITDAVKAYRGVKRRFEFVLKGEGTPVLIDDYAHHPGELEALLKSVRDLMPGRRVLVIFQPHLYSRTRDLAEGFARSLELADEAVLLPIYPARELPMEGVSSTMIAEKMKGAILLEKDELQKWLAAHDNDVVVTAGAGDIDALVPSIKTILETQTVNRS
ncbi:MAG TPA: Mur ligase family protein, partial [Phnomibacter sp.]|nr:Mur ligase family protein [Phnomibacter sp.]